MPYAILVVPCAVSFGALPPEKSAAAVIEDIFRIILSTFGEIHFCGWVARFDFWRQVDRACWGEIEGIFVFRLPEEQHQEIRASRTNLCDECRGAGIVDLAIWLVRLAISG